MAFIEIRRDSTYLAFFDADVLLGLESGEAHLEVGRVEALRRQVEHFLEFEWNCGGLYHCLYFDRTFIWLDLNY